MWFKTDSSNGRDYAEVVRRTVQMVNKLEISSLAHQNGLAITDITWEDAARFKFSAVGPNISDLTIQVEERGRTPRLSCMPVLRHPNFSDYTTDVRTHNLQVLVGNECGLPLRPVSLHEYLSNLKSYLSEPSSWPGNQRSVLVERDEHVLLSAQACFLPVPKSGKATFNPVLFNYQSGPGAPAVLSIIATREGTSATIIDNQRDAFSAGDSWGQRLFHNQDGERSSLTGERLSDFRDETGVAGEADTGLNAVMLIQVPLKLPAIQRRSQRGGFGLDGVLGSSAGAPVADCLSDVEEAVIGHGEAEGPFVEMDGLRIRRDERFPIRVTVQLYQATSNGVVTRGQIRGLAAKLDELYSDGELAGSLVTGGHSGRSTEYTPSSKNPHKTEPAAWWGAFWRHYERSTGRSQHEAWQRLQSLKREHSTHSGTGFEPRDGVLWDDPD